MGPLRAHLVRRRRHGVRAAAARRGRRTARGARASARHDEAPRPHASRHRDGRPLARRRGRAHELRAQARGLGLRARSRPRPDPPRSRDRRGRCDQRRGRHVRVGRSPGGGARLRATGPAERRGVDPGDPARSSRRVHDRPRHHRVHPRQDGDGDPPPRADGGSRGAGAVRGRAEGLVRDAAQAEPGGVRACVRSGARDPRLRADGPREHGPVARARHLALVGGADDLPRRHRAPRVHAPRPGLGARRADRVPRPDAREPRDGRRPRVLAGGPPRIGGRGALPRRGLRARPVGGRSRLGRGGELPRGVGGRPRGRPAARSPPRSTRCSTRVGPS